MTYVFSSNNLVCGLGPDSAPNGDKLWYEWKEFMKSVGWTVSSSGDGLSTFSTTGDVITGYTTGAGGLGNASAWFIVKEPVGGLAGLRREFLVFKNTTATAAASACRQVAYSAGGYSTTLGHNSVAISATNPPIAFDMVWHSVSQPTNCFNLAATYNSTLGINSVISMVNTNICNYTFMADNAAPWGWYILSTQKNIGQPNQIWYMAFDPLQNYDTGDTDPTSWFTFTNYDSTTGIFVGNPALGSSARTWYNWRAFVSKADSTAATAAFSSYYGFCFSSSEYNSLGGFPSSCATIDTATLNSTVPVFPMVMLTYTSSSASPYYYKGTSSLHKYPGSVLLPYIVVSVNTDRDYLSLGLPNGGSYFLIPWSGALYNQ